MLGAKILTSSQSCQAIKNNGKTRNWKLIIAKNVEVVYWFVLRKKLKIQCQKYLVV